MKPTGKIRHWAGAMKRQLRVLQFAVRDPRTPTLAKFVVIAVIAYALSPIDLIPDFIPVLGLLDDLLLVPLGIFIAVKLIPPDVMNDAKQRAGESTAPDTPAASRHAAAIVIIAIWLVAIGLLIRYLAGR